MNALERSQLLESLRERRDAIARSWRDAVAPTSFTSLTAVETRRRLGDLTEQAITVLLSEPFERHRARAVGSELAGMHYLNPETVSGTQEVLASQLVEGLSADQAVKLQPRLAVLLAEVAVGFFERARETILLEQEQVKTALLSERRQVQDALRKSEASLALAQRVAHLGHWDYDWINDKLHWSDEIYRIFGVTKQEFGGAFEDYFERVHPDDRRFIEKATEEAVRGGSVSLEHRIVRPSGEVRFVQHRLQFVFDEQRTLEGYYARGANGKDNSSSKKILNCMLDRVARKLGQLPGKLVRVIGTVQDITERKVLEDRLEHLALHDPLTDLPNRTLFLDRLEHALSRRDRREESVAVLFLDLDGFKLVNDSFGHVVGDQLLLKVANRLEACVRPQDTVARFGGDEFTVLLEDATETNSAALVAQRIIEELRTPFTLREQEVYVTATIGIVSRASERDLPEDLLRRADTAMYQAKARNKGGYETFEPNMDVPALQQLKLGSELRRAVEREEFVIHYQPKVELATGKVVGMEALLRWEHPERGLVYPNEFIPLAEEMGVIVPIGQWVSEETCHQARLWQERYPRDLPLTVSMNLSARQLQHPGLAQEITRAILESGVDPKGLELEITESVIMEDEEVASSKLKELKSLGVHLTIDDFGTGYSSLSYLRHLPVDSIKIDKSFVEGLGQDPKDRLITSAMLSLAQTLGLGVVAEGVETIEQLRQLRKLGCDLAQGNYFSKPVTTGEATAFVATGFRFKQK